MQNTLKCIFRHFQVVKKNQFVDISLVESMKKKMLKEKNTIVLIIPDHRLIPDV